MISPGGDAEAWHDSIRPPAARHAAIPDKLAMMPASDPSMAMTASLNDVTWVGDVDDHDLSRTGGDLGGRPAEILALFTGQQDLTATDIAQATGLSKAMTNRHLARLVAEGQLIATAPPASRNRAYRLPPNAP